MRLLLSVALILALASLLLGAASADGEVKVSVSPPDLSNWPDITVYVRVTDQAGQPVRHFTRENFQVLEEGKQVQIVDFAGMGDVRPVDIVFVFDTTGSMREEIEGVKNTAVAFADKLRDNKRDYRLGLVAFGDEIREVQKPDGGLTGNIAEFKSWIARQRADGGGDEPEISLDALERAMQMRYREKTQKILILITDAPPHEKAEFLGINVFPARFTRAEVLAHLTRQNFTVYPVTPNLPVYRQMEVETGGTWFDISKGSDFSKIVDQIGGLIADQYRITYRTPRPVNDGTRRPVEVKIVEAGGGAIGGGQATYVEPHLLIVRSNLVWFAIFLVPLLALLLVPQLRRPGRRTPPVAEPLPGPIARPAPLEALPPSPPVAVPPVAPMPAPPPPTLAPIPVAPRAGPAPAARLLIYFELPAQGGTVGSAEGNALVFRGPGLAARHARFTCEPDGRWTVEDLSGGQTQVSFSGDPAKLRPSPRNLVREGSLVRLASQDFVFRQPAAGPPQLETAISLPSAGVTLGSAPDCDVVVPGAAPRHAEIRAAVGRWTVTDLGAAGGTRVSYSGDPAQERPVAGSNALKDGSTVRIGKVKAILRVA